MSKVSKQTFIVEAVRNNDPKLYIRLETKYVHLAAKLHTSCTGILNDPMSRSAIPRERMNQLGDTLCRNDRFEHISNITRVFPIVVTTEIKPRVTQNQPWRSGLKYKASLLLFLAIVWFRKLILLSNGSVVVFFLTVDVALLISLLSMTRVIHFSTRCTICESVYALIVWCQFLWLVSCR